MIEQLQHIITELKLAMGKDENEAYSEEIFEVGITLGKLVRLIEQGKIKV